MNIPVGEVGTLTVDRSVCIGSGQCVLAREDIFGQDDETGLVEVVVDAIDATLAAVVLDVADACPSGALRFERAEPTRS